ncbi:hypothetical protein [Pedobacter insulae]|uniref:Uncharacterized protein n=1 Tax=Pedobacter insulae TaxID=414048 RepID=A0A1I2XL18_9SPHI|nr:hypothetical protein [Pedobacter insulae]SFH14105.1 hypothetical protein SAMN04489864_105320 [Pedobacter insulae]
MKTYYFFLIAIFLSIICNAQSIDGSYRYKNEDFSASRTITFSKKHFREEIQGDVTVSIGAGTYRIKNNRLILKYQLFSDQDTSSYQISSADKPAGSAIVDVKVFDSSGTTMAANYGLRDVYNSPLSVIPTNNNGLGNMTIYNNNVVGYFTIDCIGYYRVSIPIKRLMNKTTSIIVYLRPQTKYYIEPHIVNYKIIEVKRERLVLLENSKILMFEKLK